MRSKIIILLSVAALIFAACRAETEKEYVNVVDTTAPAVVTQLKSNSGNGMISLSWKNPADEDFYGTKITFTPAAEGVTQPLVILGEKSKDSSALIRGLKNGTEYTFSLFALDKNVNESVAATISGTPQDLNPADTTPPAEVTDLTLTPLNKRVKLEWQDPQDSDLFGIEINWVGGEVSRAISAMTENSLFVAPKTQYAEVPNLTAGVEYTFTVKAMDTNGNKSEGIIKKSKPLDAEPGNPLRIELSVPNELSNTTVKVTANVKSDDTVRNVVFKKDGTLIASRLLGDAEAVKAKQDSTNNSLWTFEVSANGTYSVAAIDNVGRESSEQCVVKTLDFFAPDEVRDLTINCNSSAKNIKLDWKDPATSTDELDSPFDHIEITYTTNDGTSESKDYEPIIVQKNEQTYTLEGISSEKLTYTFTVKTVDLLGNKSVGKIISCNSDGSVIVPKGFVLINGATVSASIGDSSRGPFYKASESPVTVGSFFIAETELTYSKWYEVFQWAVSDERGDKKYTFSRKGREGYSESEESDGAAPTDGKNLPVTYITWRDALVWCNAASEKDGLSPVYLLSETDKTPLREAESASVTGGTGKAEKAFVDKTANGYRLPTSAEWEFAARGGNPLAEEWNYIYAGTNDYSKLGDYAAIKEEDKILDVKSKLPNSALLYDMTGNVCEYCYDGYSEGVGDANNRRYTCGSIYGASADNLKLPGLTPKTMIRVFFDTGFRVVRNVE